MVACHPEGGARLCRRRFAWPPSSESFPAWPPSSELSTLKAANDDVMGLTWIVRADLSLSEAFTLNASGLATGGWLGPVSSVSVGLLQPASDGQSAERSPSSSTPLSHCAVPSSDGSLGPVQPGSAESISPGLPSK